MSSTNRTRSARIDKDLLAAAVSADDLAARIAAHSGGTPKKRSGGYLVRCPNPSHEDRNPSCSVSDKNGAAVYHCFACDASGNAFSWFKLVHGDRASFPDLLADVAAEFGVDPAAVSKPSEGRGRRRDVPPDSAYEDESYEFAADAAQAGHEQVGYWDEVPPDDYYEHYEDSYADDVGIDYEPPSGAEPVESERPAAVAPPAKAAPPAAASPEPPTDWDDKFERRAEREHVPESDETRALLQRFARSRRIDLDRLLGKLNRENGIDALHVARRPHKCSTKNGCPTDSKQWDHVLVVRALMLNAEGRVEGWQDIVPSKEADVHYGGVKKLAASGCSWPMFGLDRAAASNRMLLVEGVTDWLTAVGTVDHWGVVAAMGANRMAETIRATAATSQPQQVIVIGDGDTAGLKGEDDAELALDKWSWTVPVLCARPQRGMDFSDFHRQITDEKQEGWANGMLEQCIRELSSQSRRAVVELALRAEGDPPTVESQRVYPSWPDSETAPGRWVVSLDVDKTDRYAATVFHISSAERYDRTGAVADRIKNRNPSPLMRQELNNELRIARSASNLRLQCEVSESDGVSESAVVIVHDYIRSIL